LCLTKDALFPESTIGEEREEERRSKAKGKRQKCGAPTIEPRAGGYFCQAGQPRGNFHCRQSLGSPPSATFAFCTLPFALLFVLFPLRVFPIHPTGVLLFLDQPHSGANTITKRDLDDRLLAYAAAIVRTVELLPRDFGGNHLGRQLLRCGTSAGANYQEAQAAESRKDFLHKLQVALKEMRESLYWLRLLEKTKSLSEKELAATLDEASQLTRILSKSVATAKANAKRNEQEHSLPTQ
jgi:four helix bundle protein